MQIHQRNYMGSQLKYSETLCEVGKEQAQLTAQSLSTEVS
jgi:hypothetical protein